MTSEEFWKDDPQLFVSYRTSFINKKKREMEELDYKCWLQGLYIHDGNGKLSLSLRQFLGNLVASMFKGKRDNSEIETYPTKPYGELNKEKQQSKDKQNKKYVNYQEDFVYFGTLKQRYLDNLKNKQKKGE
jgi:hypothetical protein